jgi:DNA-binding transcriptional regulator YiaG
MLTWLRRRRLIGHYALMNQDEFRAALEEYGLTQPGAAKFFGVDERTARRWASTHDVPDAVAMVFALMRRFNLTPSQVRQILEEEK